MMEWEDMELHLALSTLVEDARELGYDQAIHGRHPATAGMMKDTQRQLRARVTQLAAHYGARLRGEAPPP